MTVFDESAFPLIRVTFSPELPEDEIARAAAGTRDVLSRGRRVLFIVDISRLEVSFTVQRRTQLHELMASLQRDADRLMIAAFYVAPNVVARGVVTALNWSRGKRPYPVRVFPTVADAEAAAQGLL